MVNLLPCHLVRCLTQVHVGMPKVSLPHPISVLKVFFNSGTSGVVVVILHCVPKFEQLCVYLNIVMFVNSDARISNGPVTGWGEIRPRRSRIGGGDTCWILKTFPGFICVWKYSFSYITNIHKDHEPKGYHKQQFLHLWHWCPKTLNFNSTIPVLTFLLKKISCTIPFFAPRKYPHININPEHHIPSQWISISVDMTFCSDNYFSSVPSPHKPS